MRKHFILRLFYHIKRIYSDNNAVWIESNDKVRYADGTIDYMTVLTMHNNSISLKVGDVIKQGTPYYKEGTRGYAIGNHIHLSVGKGKFIGSGWYQNSNGNWCINNQYDVHKALFLDNNTVLLSKVISFVCLLILIPTISLSNTPNTLKLAFISFISVSVDLVKDFSIKVPSCL